ncbi:unnamed protein product [Laminaria digitata]
MSFTFLSRGRKIEPFSFFLSFFLSFCGFWFLFGFSGRKRSSLKRKPEFLLGRVDRQQIVWRLLARGDTRMIQYAERGVMCDSAESDSGYRTVLLVLKHDTNQVSFIARNFGLLVERSLPFGVRYSYHNI